MSEKGSGKQPKQLSNQALKAYDRMLERVEARLAKAEKQTLDTLRHEIDDAVEVETELRRLTRDEASLLAAYLRRDLEHLVTFVEGTGEGLREWLQFDLSLMENKLEELLFSIADKTRVETLELNQKIDNQDATHYMAGEVATAGMFRCLNCNHMKCLTATSQLEPCEACEAHYFERVTGKWPE
ncbi:Zinc-ribbon containing domain-containing protein [Marinobacter daqiaonensis]|uniref:Zinc-ribbon containing domain-containing protein n=1 Tax=Marinobacter daqiaonensis TaxID=650891 RepID=A0A1I6HCX5_9GAMM|nr:zinc ribbon-containing protein [Marinobacter daqiaonensis]SFR52228.1 Zinc-ribbon containing domain-containing protein [Marinobacter daqiaonensis]